MRQRKAELHELGVQVAIVTFEGDRFARAYVSDTNLEWPVLIDSDRTLYGAYGMGRGRLWQIYSPATIASYLKLMIRGRRPRVATGDTYQLGGDVLIDPEGIIRILHVSEDPADRPEVEDILRVVRKQ